MKTMKTMKTILILVAFALMIGCSDDPQTVKDAYTNNDVEISSYYYDKLPTGAENIRLIEGAEEKPSRDVWFTFDLEGDHFLIGMYGGGDRFGMCLTQVQ